MGREPFEHASGGRAITIAARLGGVGEVRRFIATTLPFGILI
jgi:hypothetical protein